MAAENLMLSATQKGLGTCVIRSFHPILIQKLLKVPEHIFPEFLVLLGYPDKWPSIPKRRALDQVVAYNLEEKQ